MALKLPAPSKQQKVIFDFVTNGSGNGLVGAVAGSGKTTTLMGILQFVRGNVALVAFNKPIAEQLKAKVAEMSLPSARVFAGTFHSFGMSAINKNIRGTTVVKDKFDEHIVDDVPNPRQPETKGVPKILRNFVRKAYNLARQKGFGLDGGIAFSDSEAWTQLVDDYRLVDEFYEDKKSRGTNVELDENVDQLVRMGCQWAVFCIRYGQAIIKDHIDFEDMIYAPLYHKWKIYTNDWVLVDECQDLNTSRRLFAKAMVGAKGRFIGVGDPCQPLGTKVQLIRKKAYGGGPHGNARAEIIENVNIEDVVIGDKVISYDTRNCAFVKGRAVLGITRKPYSGHLVNVSMENGMSSRYTVNHHCLANFSSLRDKYCVYLMRKGDNFRIGKCRMAYQAGNGVDKRMEAENADCAWILDVFDTSKEALIAELQISANYGLSMTMFTEKNNSAFTTEDYNIIWGGIKSHSNRALECLNAYGRNIDYPLVSASNKDWFSLKMPGIFRACNLLDGVLMLPYENGAANHAKKAQWKPVKITREQYDGDVVSFSVEKEQLYCADGIMTHNCQAIYKFAGADAASYAMIRTDFNCKEFPLSVSWRCTKNIVQYARQWSDLIEAAPDAPEGEPVKTIEEDEFYAMTPDPTDAILCRVNAPLVDLFFRYLRRGIPAKIQGRDIGEKLLNLLTRFKGTATLGVLTMELKEWSEKEIKKFLSKKKIEKAAEVADLTDTLVAVIQNVPANGTVDSVSNYIKTMFEDVIEGSQKKQVVVLSSSHKSKGLEFPRVFWMGKNIFNPSFYAIQSENPDDMEQERNLMYITSTRAMKELIEVRMTKKDKRASFAA